MITFMLEPADGEHEFKANAFSIRGAFTITGSWSKDENGVTQINFKMTFQKFQSESWSAFFDGQFDGERDALNGVWGFSAGSEDPRGGMEFRRILPHHLTLYPSVKELSDNKPRALWGFAIAVVRDDVRRARWAWLYKVGKIDRPCSPWDFATGSSGHHSTTKSQYSTVLLLCD